MPETAEKAKSLFEEAKPYHLDARRTLPVLVRQAQAGETIEYGVLAAEVGVNGARNMAYPLGSIGKTLVELGGRWCEEIPPLETLVVNKADELPGSGVAHFLPDPKAFARATRREKRIIIREVLQEVFEYKHWYRVLAYLELEPLPIPDLPDADLRGRAAEGPEHLALKQFIASNPHLVGAEGMVSDLEMPLTSGDVVDVMFRSSRRVLAVEVKGARSATDDLVRGVFQSVKYQAVLEAEAKIEGVRRHIDSILAIGGPLPAVVRRVANTLGVTIVDELTEE